MAFAEHETAILQFNDTACQTIVNGEKCKQQHCVHANDTNICEMGDDEKFFKTRYCGACRMALYHYLQQQTENKKEILKKKALETGTDYFIATGYYNGNGLWQYEHVNTDTTFWWRAEPTTDDIIRECGEKWLATKTNSPQTMKCHQTLMENFLT
ncbi:Hypothetical predicted protein [Paramuricea clavata]|uniref:Uncharacterized protein n=1 Tax=Paramuricea clavata TaxID=317549 RepID=A0A6S7H7E5_PARCT|nr:Hypothetical predicted protein [Paramuricea clavata]